jgi:predicted metal-binding transcription factor (methanogenesis marker protein 9)
LSGDNVLAKIKIDGKSVKPRKSTVRSQYAADEKYTGTEPVWDTERASAMYDADFDHHLRKSFNYYNYHFNQRELKKHVVEWMLTESTFNKDDVKVFEKVPDAQIPMVLCSIIMAYKAGMPLKEKLSRYVIETIAGLITKTDFSSQTGTPQKSKKPVVTAKPITIQDRIAEKTSEQLGDFEGAYDDIIKKMPGNFKAYEYFVKNNVPQSQLGKFEELILYRQREIQAAQQGTDPQLVEAYKHYKAATYKAHLAFFKQCLDDIAQYRSVKQATKKARVKKPTSKDKIVSKVQYLKEDKILKMVSINPVDIIGAKVLWVYNVKTRKLGKYQADDMAELGIKGTSIINFNVMTSIGKIIRKPTEKLKEFMRANKTQLKKFLNDIKATETKLAGRINSDTILLKVET